MPIIDSDEQLAFYSAVRNDTASLMLIAVAGSGKTTTLERCLQHIEAPSSKLIRFMAFNKRIAEELERRLPQFVQCGTFHKFSLSALSRHLPRRPKIDGDKIHKILKESLSFKQMELYGSYVKRLIGFAKNAGVGTIIQPDSGYDTWFKLVAHNGLTLESGDADPEQAIAFAQQAFAQSNSDLSSIDFDDMLYLAVALNITFDKCTYLIGDELQDTNLLQQELIARQLSPYGGRFLGVGDPRQAIYGFRGADATAMDKMIERFQMKVLTLSTCYRCSKAVVRETQRALARHPALRHATL